MAITQQTALNQRELTGDGTVQVRLALRVMNGDTVVTSQWHRFTLYPGVYIDNVLTAVNSHLAQDDMGNWPAISDGDAAKIRASCAAEQTPEVIAAYQAAQSQ